MQRYVLHTVVARAFGDPSVLIIRLAALALSIASGVRTFQGMQSFTDKFWILSALITFSVQALMLVLAWRLGDAYATSARDGNFPRDGKHEFWRLILRNFFVTNLLLILSFLTCALICVFFSFDAFFKDISTREHRDITSANAAREVVRNIATDLAQELELQRQHVAKSVETDSEWPSYTARIDAVVGAATDPTLAAVQANIAMVKRTADEAEAEKIRTQVAQATRSKNEAESTRKRLMETKAESERKLEDLANESRGLELEADRLQKELSNREDELERLRRQRSDEARNGNGRRIPGTGSEWKRLNALVIDAEHARDDLIGPSARAKEAAAKNQKNRNALQKTLHEIELELANVIARSQQIRMPVLPTGEEAGSPKNGLPKAVEAAEILRKQLAEFPGDPSGPNLVSLESQCTRTVGFLREIPKAPASIGALNCSSLPSTREKLERLKGIDDRRMKFGTTCVGVQVGAMPFAALLELGKNCLQIAQISNERVTALERDLAQAESDLDEKAPSFNKTIAAFARGDKLAYLAAAMALALDGLVLMTGIWGGRMNVSPLTRSGETTAAEIDDHAEMMMMMEVRPNELRRAAIERDPPEVYKARIFVLNVKPCHDEHDPDVVGAISLAELSEIDRQAVRSILNIGKFARASNSAAHDDTWLVTDRLLRYATRIVAQYDRMQRLFGERDWRLANDEEDGREPLDDVAFPYSRETSYWADAASSARRETASGPAPLSEEDFVDLGYRKFAEGAPMATNDDLTEESDEDQRPQNSTRATA